MAMIKKGIKPEELHPPHKPEDLLIGGLVRSYRTVWSIRSSTRETRVVWIVWFLRILRILC